MQILVGQQYPILNANVPEGQPGSPPWLRVYELTPYRGHCVVYGEKLSYENHLYNVHGHEVIPASGACGVILSSAVRETLETLKPLLVQLSGQPLLMGEPAWNGLWDVRGLAPESVRGTPFLNWSYQLGRLWWCEDRPGHDESLRQAQRVIDLYSEWRDPTNLDGRFPQWFRQARNASHDTPQLASLTG